jgi:creatinine amidohydrolase
LTPSDPNSPNYSRSGCYGDPTRATSAKGEALLAAMLDDLHEQAATFIAQGTEQHRQATVQSVLR